MALPVKNALSVSVRSPPPRRRPGAKFGRELRSVKGMLVLGGLQGVTQAAWKGPEHIPKAELDRQVSHGWDPQLDSLLALSGTQY